MNQIVGRLLWEQLHLVASQKSANQKVFFLLWLNRVKFNLGCETCFKKVKRFCEIWPPEFGATFELWGWCLHDYVNKEMGKPMWIPHKTLEPLKQKGIVQ